MNAVKVKAVKVKALKICVLLVATFLMSHAQTTSRESDKVRVLALENLWNEAEKHKDVKALDTLLANSFAYTDSDGSFMNKTQFLASITAPGYHPAQIVNETMNAEPYDHVVIVTGTYREQGTEKGKPYTRRGRFTDTWIQDSASWLCAASQETLVTR
jgi:ketosteroid isomerase-like protein